MAALERAGLGVTADGDFQVIGADDPARVGELAFEAGVPLLSGQPGPDLASSDYNEVVGGGRIAVVLATALGVGIGMVIKNQVAAWSARWSGCSSSSR